MSVAINTVLLGGHLTRDPQVRFLERAGGEHQAVGNFGLAINRRFKGSDGQMKEEVTFVDIECWGRTAELAGQYLVKGRAVFVEGRLKLDQWDDKDGQKRQKLKVVADSLQFLDSGNRTGAAGEAASAAPATPSAQRPPRPAAAVGDDEPPF